MLFVPSLAFALLALEAAAGSIPKSAHREHGWERRWLAPRNAPMKLHIALRQEDDGARVEHELLSISNPDSPRFRQYMTGEEVPYLAVPAQGSVHVVESWLWQHDLLAETSLFGGIFEIDTTIRQAERLLNTTYFVFSDGTKDVIRNELFYLPDNVMSHIDFVAPTTNFPKPKARRAAGDITKGQISPVLPKHEMHLQQSR